MSKKKYIDMPLQFLAAYYKLAEGCEHILYQWSPPGTEPFPFAVRGANLRSKEAFYADLADEFTRYPAQMTLSKRAGKILDRFRLASQEAELGRPSLTARYEVWVLGELPGGLPEAFEAARQEQGFQGLLVGADLLRERIARIYHQAEAGFWTDDENQFIQAMQILRLARERL